MKHVSILIPASGPNLISITATYKGLRRANQFLAERGKKPLFKVELVGLSKKAVSDEGLFSVKPQATINDIKKTDLVIIPALSWNFPAMLEANKKLIPWIAQQHKRGAEIASMCTGAFLLAATGLLNGKSCSTHWMAAERFHRLFPEVNLTIDRLITEEAGIMTNGGAFSFLNLLLYLIEKYYGRECAIYCAKVFVVDMDRDSQSDFTIFSGLKEHQDEAIKKAQQYIEKHVGEKISVAELASRFAVGRRNFDRRFIRATSTTPAEYLQRVKIEAAKKSLELSNKTVSEVMYDTGYTDRRAFRGLFKKITGLTPLQYRAKYNRQAVGN